VTAPLRRGRSGRLSLVTRRDRGSNPFLRGLTIGVLVGAAIAGSRIWRRLVRRPGAA
jgi:hypothetical protein